MLFKSKIHQLLNSLIIYGICSYLAIMFLSKGEAVRNILLYGSFVLWLISLRWDKQTDFFRQPLSRFYFVFVAISILSVSVSFDPLHSLKAIRHELLKGVILFTILATSFNSEKSMKKLIISLSIAGTAIVFAAFYSYFTLDITMVKPHITIMHAWHNRFARQVCMTLPFIVVLSFLLRGMVYKSLLWALTILSAAGILLSTSRAGYVAFVAMAFIWILILLRGHRNMKRIVTVIIAIFITVNAVAWISSPKLRTRASATSIELKTFNRRTEAWIPIFYAIKTRPLLGWGYGPKLVMREEPYLGSDYNSPTIGAHNTFLEVTFASGVIGLLSFISLIGYSIFFCLKNIYHRDKYSLGALMLLAVFSIIIGNHILHAQLANVSFRGLSILLGISLSAVKLDS